MSHIPLTPRGRTGFWLVRAEGPRNPECVPAQSLGLVPGPHSEWTSPFSRAGNLFLTKLSPPSEAFVSSSGGGCWKERKEGIRVLNALTLKD